MPIFVMYVNDEKLHFKNFLHVKQGFNPVWFNKFSCINVIFNGKSDKRG